MASGKTGDPSGYPVAATNREEKPTASLADRSKDIHLNRTTLDADQHRDLGPSAISIPDTHESDASVAAAQLLPTSSITGDDVSIYQLKWVEWGREFAPVIVQNENGPCPLLALCNVLILTGGMKIPPGHTDVSSTYLTDLLGAYLLESQKTSNLSEGEKANLEQNIQDTMAIFPKLQTGLDVNVKFNSVSGFEFTREIGLFDLVGVPLYHGWLVEPENSRCYEVVKNYSYNRLVEMIINNSAAEDSQLLQEAMLGQQFLESTASQLTYHGICELNSTVCEGELCVFFRNNHFNTLMKRRNVLMTLVTDHGFLNEMGYVWQVLSDIDGGGEFLDATFNPSPHSQTQQKRQEAVPSSSPSHDVETPTDMSKTDDTEGVRETLGMEQDLDYQTALNLQEEEYTGQHQPSSGGLQQELMDHELAAQLQQQQEDDEQVEPPPNSAEEYERASAQDRQQAKSDCSLL